jgi:hypothetical protein
MMNTNSDGTAADGVPKSIDDFLGKEAKRCASRRRSLFGHEDGMAAEAHTEPALHDRFELGRWTTDDGNWALALSGGGIRSATFCLGVLQGLAETRALPVLPPNTAAASAKRKLPLLAQFDYVSSASGGGFVAGFLQSLYTTPDHQGAEGAKKVFAHLAEEPPGRVHLHPKPTPLAWLRENGRYLAPTGAGDMIYGIGLSIRNWLGVQSLIGVAVLGAVALCSLIVYFAQQALQPSLVKWWSVPLAIFMVWALPSAGAYWLLRDPGLPGRRSALPLLRITGVFCVALLLMIFGGSRLYLVCGGILMLTGVWAAVAECLRTFTRAGKADLYVWLTAAFAAAIEAGAAVLVVELVLWVAHWAAHWVAGDLSTLFVSGAGAGVLVAAYRHITKVVSVLRGPASSVAGSKGAVRRPVNLILALAAIVMAGAVAVFWGICAYLLMAPASSIEQIAPKDMAGLLALCVLFVVVVGRWRSILNMSGYHYSYSARLTRAYLGAANPARTTADPKGAVQSAKEEMAARTTANPVDGDAVEYARYHANAIAPIHLINITLNNTVDPAEQLVQRDRKGQPFVVLPHLDSAPEGTVSVAIDGHVEHVRGDGAELSIGDWLAISGAAASSGMGRRGSVGAAVCATLANVRIGRWWQAKLTEKPSTDGFWRRQLPTYAYLADELRGRFQGRHRDMLYLTDGGHFENTGVYELLRRIKDGNTKIRFILMCDCGADDDYTYGDLANLVRLARIDFQLEIEVDQAAAEGQLGSVFGTPETMRKADPARLDSRCAVLLNVRDMRHPEAALARILMIKPRLIQCAATDLLDYVNANATFPQQTTGDQFFDQDQWESYRKLGLECCRKVLSQGLPLWRAVLDPKLNATSLPSGHRRVMAQFYNGHNHRSSRGRTAA